MSNVRESIRLKGFNPKYQIESSITFLTSNLSSLNFCLFSTSLNISLISSFSSFASNPKSSLMTGYSKASVPLL